MVSLLCALIKWWRGTTIRKRCNNLEQLKCIYYLNIMGLIWINNNSNNKYDIGEYMWIELLKINSLKLSSKKQNL